MEPNNPIERQASDWLARRDAGLTSAADRADFDAWLNASTIHRVEYLRMEHVWDATKRLKVLGAGERSERVPPRGRWTLSAFFRANPRGLDKHPPARRLPALAAVAAVFSISIGILTFRAEFQDSDRYATAVGKVALVPLTDGSRVTLNTDSRIRVKMTATERQVDLLQGEVFFEVAKDASRPFTVKAGDSRVIAVGTQFSVRREEAGGAQIVVTEGKVRVESAASAPTAAPQMLAAGSIAQASASGTLVQTKPLAQTEDLMSWRRGILVFHDATLSDAAAEFNRYNAHKIRIADPRIGELRIAGSFRSTNADAFVRLLERGYPLRADVNGDEIVLREP
jgi:transmembrane sensor